jgi:hypothetical protein
MQHFVQSGLLIGVAKFLVYHGHCQNFRREGCFSGFFRQVRQSATLPRQFVDQQGTKKRLGHGICRHTQGFSKRGQSVATGFGKRGIQLRISPGIFLFTCFGQAFPGFMDLTTSSLNSSAPFPEMSVAYQL